MTTIPHNVFPTSSEFAPSWAPHYGASIPVAWRRFWVKYVDFTGRASRSEYWWIILLSVIYSVVVQIAAIPFQVSSGQMPTGPGQVIVGALFGNRPAGAAQIVFEVLSWAVSLGTLLPSLSLTVRRLHDTDRSAHYLWRFLIPVAGPIMMLVYSIQASRPGGARFDRPTAPDPRAPGVLAQTPLHKTE